MKKNGPSFNVLRMHRQVNVKAAAAADDDVDDAAAAAAADCIDYMHRLPCWQLLNLCLLLLVHRHVPKSKLYWCYMRCASVTPVMHADCTLLACRLALNHRIKRCCAMRIRHVSQAFATCCLCSM